MGTKHEDEPANLTRGEVVALLHRLDELKDAVQLLLNVDLEEFEPVLESLWERVRPHDGDPVFGHEEGPGR